MGIKGVAVSLLLISTILLTSSCIPSSSAEDDDAHLYGATSGITYDDIDGFFVSHFSKHLTEMLEESVATYGYSLDLHPSMEVRISLEREVTEHGDVHVTDDHLVGYIETRLVLNPTGNFPSEGTYAAKEGENELGLLLRVLTENQGPESVQKHIDNTLNLYFDLNLVTTTNLATGEMEHTDVSFKFFAYESEDMDAEASFVTDDESNPVSVTISYDRHVSDSDLYLDLEMDLDYEGLKIISGTDPWLIDLVITEHIVSVVVSSDLVDSVWMNMVSDSVDGIAESKLPKLIMNIIGSSTNKTDIIRVIESLTSTEIPDISFTSSFNAQAYTDTRGYEYVKLSPVDDDTVEFKLGINAVSMDLSNAVMLIPDYIIPHSDKLIIALAMVFLGWNDIDVKDITSDPEEQAKCGLVHSHVDSAITKDDEVDYGVPPLYIGLGSAGLVAMIAVAALAWRRVI